MSGGVRTLGFTRPRRAKFSRIAALASDFSDPARSGQRILGHVALIRSERTLRAAGCHSVRDMTIRRKAFSLYREQIQQELRAQSRGMDYFCAPNAFAGCKRRSGCSDEGDGGAEFRR